MYCSGYALRYRPDRYARAVDGNALYYGDNLDVLRRHVKDDSVDLVYLDPPFNSDVNYNVLFAEHGEKSAAQIEAFTDTWEWNTEARLAYEEVVEAGGHVADTMRAFRTMIPGSDMLAYLAMMAPRLVELHRVLRPTGSLYLHCDPTASHYLKLLLDAVFDARNFRSEIVWRRTSAHGTSKRWPALHDVILFYGRTPAATFRPLRVPADEGWLEREYRFDDERGRYSRADLTAAGTREGPSGMPWRGVDPRAVGSGRHWRYHPDTLDRLDAEGRIYWPPRGDYPKLKQYLEDTQGATVGDIWTDVPVIGRTAAERLGYPTQKPIALMRRIIEASSEPGDLVLDPFCGCGTTIDAAQELGRRWVGIDITHLSIGLIKHRLVDRFGPDIAATYRTIGEPTTADDARVLAKEDPFQFQAWALGLVGARVAGSDKKGGDKGIDGRLYFHVGDGKTRQIVFSVKAGHLVPTHVRDLRGVIEREEADIGVLVSFEEATAGMRAEAAEAGFYTSPWGKHPRIQLRTVGDLLGGKAIDYPHVTGANVTHRRAQRAQARQPEVLPMFGEMAAEEPADYGDSN